MESKPKNPPAFPIINNGYVFEIGMTLRDYFAAKAMQGQMATEFVGMLTNKELASICYDIADEMLKQREL